MDKVSIDKRESNPIIALEDIRKVFVCEDIETHALSNVFLRINKGEFLAITGPSGCGKSTLLSIIGLLDTPNSGDYYLDGRDVSFASARDRTEIRNKGIGFIFQAFNLIGDLNVFENVALPLTYRNLSEDKKKKMVRTALENVEMSHRAKHFPTQLSGGQQQRVALARALVVEPTILLADEPTGNLDSHNSDSVMSILREVHKSGTTICMVTHEPRFARYAQRTVQMFDGRIVEES